MFENHQDLRTFLLVAETESFTKAAAQLGVSRSAVSQSISQLERQFGTRLFHRSTRKVATTDIGEQLFQQVAPLFQNIDQKISEVLSSQNQLRGTLRITGTPHAINTALREKFSQFCKQNPNMTLELSVDMRFVDIIKERFDAGIRTGDVLNNDVVAVKISESNTMCCVASPAYLAENGVPHQPSDLTAHKGIRFRLPTLGGLLNWEFISPDNHEKTVWVQQGGIIVNDPYTAINACLDGLGIVWIERSAVGHYLANGELVSILDDWAISYPPYYLYYPNRHPSPLLKALIEALKV
ncbi:LysR family transcriptional regulator [Bibersteinia trehalosi]|uniref:LysR family transcriptional regulator n=1 Tax=Bibersteinia trehalosi TaxID=47735 RepID=UPI00105000CE|nr:LysR family transcriptional regulator [Bibersteinia trehalosi]TCT14422.1 LysR family transcriptional regulator [Bibersteinia trehalosi]